MRRTAWGLAIFLAAALAISPATAQTQTPINTRIPPPPPPPEEPPAMPSPAAQPAPAPPVPAQVTLPAGTNISVVLDSPLSTRISQDGERVTFRTLGSVHVFDMLELPPNTAITGTVVKVRRPGAFGKPGELRVKVDAIELEGGTGVPLVAHLDSPDADKQGRLRADRDRSADLYSIGLWSLQGTLMGTQIGGGKGAAIGAGAGAAIALIMLASRKGPDLYLEPGMPFAVILDQDLLLPGPELQAAQLSYQQKYFPAGADEEGSSDGSRAGPEEGIPESQRPKLKRRPPSNSRREEQPSFFERATTILANSTRHCHRLP